MKNYLNFESELKNLEDELDKLKDPYNQDGLSEVNTVKIGKVEEDPAVPAVVQRVHSEERHAPAQGRAQVPVVQLPPPLRQRRARRSRGP